jgi:hypothetical protein
VSELASKIYARHDEVAAIYKMFIAGRDVFMHGPRRLGKSFVLDRLVDAAAKHGWTTVKIEIAGCHNARAVYRELSEKISKNRGGGATAVALVRQRIGQVLQPRSNSAGPWYQPLLSLDHESYFEHLIEALGNDTDRQWALLIDELPIALKAMHDAGVDGVAAARNFMNSLSRIRAGNPRIRWLIAGSVGIEPLARAGSYMGVLAKFQPLHLEPLSFEHGIEFVRDIAREGRLPTRSEITLVEATALVTAVGWRAAYYLDSLAQKLMGTPTDDPTKAAELVEAAIQRLLQPGDMVTFGTWEEHLRKHYAQDERALAFEVLSALSDSAQGRGINAILPTLNRPGLTNHSLDQILNRLDLDGFITVTDAGTEQAAAVFRNPLLRRWWLRYRPAAGQ